jgi:hypothetical protein
MSTRFDVVVIGAGPAIGESRRSRAGRSGIVRGIPDDERRIAMEYAFAKIAGLARRKEHAAA